MDRTTVLSDTEVRLPHQADRLKKRYDLLLLLLLVLIDRIVLLALFGTKFTGSDDVVMWLGADDMSRGIFHEPFFYGQNYGLMSEAFLAVPLIWFGIPHHIALPVITSALALFPFLFIAWLFHRHDRPAAAAMVLLIALALPVEHGIITGVSRGFVPGVAMMSLLAFATFGEVKRRTFLGLGAIFGLAMILTPNALHIGILIFSFLVIRRPRHVMDLAWAGLGALPFFALNRLAASFYESRPEYMVHGMMPFAYHPSAILEAFVELDKFFSHLMPFFWSFGWLWLPLVIALGISLLKKDRPWAIALLITTLAVILSLGVNKVHDGTGSIFINCSRMFLAVPVILALGLARGLNSFQVDVTKWREGVILLAFPILFLKLGVYPYIVEKHTRIEDHGPVAVVSVAQLKWECSGFANVSKNTDADVIIFVTDHQASISTLSIRAFGCPLLRDDLAPTFLNVHDRRTWVYQSTVDTVFDRVLLYWKDAEEWRPQAHLPGKVERPAEDMLLIKDNSLPIKTLLRELDIDIRRGCYTEVVN